MKHNFSSNKSSIKMIIKTWPSPVVLFGSRFVLADPGAPTALNFSVLGSDVAAECLVLGHL